MADLFPVFDVPSELEEEEELDALSKIFSELLEDVEFER